jgi:uncharacterized damage-inducible protein DinB
MNVKVAVKQMRSIEEFFNRSTRALSEEDSGFAPAPGLFTAAQQVAHVAQTIDWFFEGAFRPEGFSMDFEGLEKEVRACTSLVAARAWLTRAVASAVATIEKTGDEGLAAILPPNPIMGEVPRFAILSAVNDHSAHHRGAPTVYARLRGKVPPMPYMEAP